MKKAKVLLTALTVFAVVGGALAFKANTMNGNLSCTTIQGAACDATYTVTQAPFGTIGYCTLKTANANLCKTITTTTRVTVDQ